MSTSITQPRAGHSEQAPPPMRTGDRMTREEFERIYSQHPEIKRAELIEGVVYVSSAVRCRKHGKPHGQIMTWLGVDTANSPGVKCGDDSTVRMESVSEPQPDGMLPGLWLNVPALLRGDMATVPATQQESLRSPEHAKFVAHMNP